MKTTIDFGKEFIALVENNDDPKKLGRVRARVVNMFDDIETDDLPWASPYLDTNGNTFNVPEVGKLITVIFHNGNPFKPQYLSAEHYNPNLEALINGLDGDDYKTMKAVMVDHSTQIYRTSSRGLVLDHEKSNINITGGGDIRLNLRDNGSKLYLGTEDAQQSAVLGTDFMDWLDSFLDILLKGGFLGNMMKPLTPQPDLIKNIMEFKKRMRSDFLSNNVWLPENGKIKGQDREYINSTGDNLKSNYFNSMYIEGEGGPEIEDREEEPLFHNFEGIPNDDIQYTISDDTSSSSIGKYQNGKIPLSAMVKSRYCEKYGQNKVVPYLIPEAAKSFDAMIAAYDNSKFKGKQKLIITSVYRSYADQKRVYDKLGGSPRVAKVGTSVHGLGKAVDITWGVRTSLVKTNPVLCFTHPVFQWFFVNGPKFGWHFPKKLRDGVGQDEFWHIEYHGNKPVDPLIAKYSPRPYTEKDINIIRKSGGYYKT